MTSVYSLNLQTVKAGLTPCLFQALKHANPDFPAPTRLSLSSLEQPIRSFVTRNDEGKKDGAA